MPNQVPPRITEDDREATVRRLQEAFAEGHISHEEMDGHLEAVLTAKTPGDLVPVLASLPDTNTGRTLFLAGKSRRLPTRRVAGTPSSEGRVRVREGRHGLCPGQIFENPVVDIELQLRFGRARITCPTMPLSTSTTEHGLETADLQEPAAFRRSRSADPALRHYGLLGRPRTPGAAATRVSKTSQ